MSKIGLGQNSWTNDEVAAVQNFNPNFIYTMRKVPLQQLLLKTPRPYALWNGSKYQIKSKHIGAGVYEVCAHWID
jgi:hypothetical protein